MKPLFARHGRRKKKKDKWYDDCDCDVCDLACCDFGLLSAAFLSVAAVARTPGSGRSRADRAALTAIRGYRLISPRLPTRCRYEPTCSAYGHEAIARYGLRAGGRMTAARLRRCRPGIPFGTVDPVP
jgi:putative membrane protein insertion efficiency factor